MNRNTVHKDIYATNTHKLPIVNEANYQMRSAQFF